MSLSAKIFSAIHYILSGTRDASVPVAESAPALRPMEFANGSGDYQVSKQFADTRQIAASGSESLDLAGGSLSDDLNNVLTFAAVKVIQIKAHDDNVNDVVVGAGTNPLIGGPFGSDGSGSVAVPPGGVFQWVAPKTGLTVTAATGDILKVANSGSGTAVNYDIVILGT